MKRSIMYTTVALAAFASGFAGSSSIASRVSQVTRVAAEEGEPCFTSDHSSGYMVSGGHGGELYCKASGQS